MAEEIANYLEDDWNDNALNNRSNASKGYYYNYHTGGTGDLLKGVYRPEWDYYKSAGRLTVTNGEIQVDYDGSGSVDIIETPSQFYVGSWQFDWQLDPLGGDNNQINHFSIHNGDRSSDFPPNSYEGHIAEGGTYKLQKVSGGTQSNLITPGWTNDTNVHTWKHTRDSYGNFELFFDGTSQGTATDTEHTKPGGGGTFRLYFADSGGSGTAHIDNLVVN